MSPCVKPWPARPGALPPVLCRRHALSTGAPGAIPRPARARRGACAVSRSPGEPIPFTGDRLLSGRPRIGPPAGPVRCQPEQCPESPGVGSRVCPLALLPRALSALGLAPGVTVGRRIRDDALYSYSSAYRRVRQHPGAPLGRRHDGKALSTLFPSKFRFGNLPPIEQL